MISPPDRSNPVEYFLHYLNLGISPPDRQTFKLGRALVQNLSPKEIQKIEEKIEIPEEGGIKNLGDSQLIIGGGKEIEEKKQSKTNENEKYIQGSFDLSPLSELERKLADLYLKNPEIVERTVEALLEYGPVSKWTDELRPKIEEVIISSFKEIDEVPLSFEKKFGAVLHAPTLPIVADGIAGINGKLPKEFLRCLTDWKKIYFFAGLTEKLKDYDISPNKITDITVTYMQNGIQLLRAQHSCAEVRGRLKAELYLPESKEIGMIYTRMVSR